MQPRPIRVLVITPNPTDATSFYRARGVFPALARDNPGIEFFDSEKLNWEIAIRADIIFLQRPYTEDHVAAAKIVKDCNRALWVDFDDDLFSVPMGNPAYQHYSKEGTRKNIARVTAMADVVTVSTQQLRKKLLGLNKNIITIPNAFNDTIINWRPDPRMERHAIIMWRGSRTHDRDLERYLPQMAQVAEKNPGWQWLFLGEPSWRVTEVIPPNQRIIMPSIDPMQYWAEIAKIQPIIQIVPLEDNEFNRSKSNIAWIEASYSGAATLAPNWEEWRRKGVVLYDSQEDFGRKLQNMIEQAQALPRMAHQSWEDVCAHFLLTRVNANRAQVIRSLAAQERKFGYESYQRLLQQQKEMAASSAQASASTSKPSATTTNGAEVPTSECMLTPDLGSLNPVSPP